MGFPEKVDKFLEDYFPSIAVKRKADKMALRTAEAYESIAPWRQSGDWHSILDGSGELTNQAYRDEARRKARHLERNSEIINSIVYALERNIVGKGFNLQVRSDNDDWNNAVEALWQAWSKPGNCDMTGRYSLNELLNMIVRRKAVDGGILAVISVDLKDKWPLRVQMFEVDELYNIGNIKSAVNDNPIVGGIEVTPYGKPVAYYIKQNSFDSFVEPEPIRVPAERVLFLAEHNRPSEVREMTRFVRTLNKIHDLDEFFEAVSFKQKINAAIAVWITSSSSGTVGNSLVANATAGATGGNTAPGKRIVPGSVNKLAPGEDVRTLVPSGQATELSDYNLAIMRQIAAGQGLSYEMISRDVSQVNYSSARQNLLEDWKVFEQEQKFIIEHFLDRIFEELVNIAVMSGKLVAPADYYTNPQKYLKHEFIGQGLPWLDPNKEADANKTMLETAQTSLKDIYAKKGKDWEEELRQIEKEKAVLAQIYPDQQEGVKENAET